ncbi:MAG: T9SS type A sorting domain-containing protein [Candidatus Kapabacteria bacterium]|nr:T9SS type A sorting domain-containing protein [Candidatus Kapabacteria bacterium]
MTLSGAIVGKDTLNEVPNPKIATLAPPPITQLSPNNIVTVPIRLSGLDSLGEVFAAAPRLTVLFNKKTLQLYNVPQGYSADSTAQNDTVRVFITPPLNRSTLATLQFRMNPTAELSETTVDVSLESKATKTLAFVLPQAGRIVFAPRKQSSIFRFLAVDSSYKYGDTARIGAYLTGTRDIAEFGITRIQATVPMPLTVAQPLTTVATINGYAMIPMEFVLSTNTNSASAFAQVRIFTTASVSVPLALTDLKAIPNVADFEVFGNAAFLRVRSPQPQLARTADTAARPSIISLAPNPVQNDISLSYSLPNDSFISIRLYDIQGNIVQTLLPRTLRLSGVYTEKFSITDLQQAEYRLILQTDNEVAQSRVIVHR